MSNKEKLIIVLSMFLSLKSFTQNNWTIFGNNNTSLGTNFLGTTSNDGVDFKTNGISRLMINNGGTGLNDGRIAIGNNLPVGFAPQSRVHIHQTGGGGLNNTFIRFTTNVTNNTASDGFAIGNSTQGFTGNNAFAHINF